jgi:hypothetical protein|eukprot:SAG25_NODE_1016_length_4295_cov_104.680172_5_plen_256_part_00
MTLLALMAVMVPPASAGSGCHPSSVRVWSMKTGFSETLGPLETTPHPTWLLTDDLLERYDSPIPTPVKSDDEHSGTAFDHPAGWHTRHDIERIRAQIASGHEPWASAYTALMDEDAVGTGDATLHYHPSPGTVVCRDCGPAPPGAPPWDGHNETGNNHFQEDARVAYWLMVKWIATGNISYANVAENLIDAWSDQLTGDHCLSNLPLFVKPASRALPSRPFNNHTLCIVMQNLPGSHRCWQQESTAHTWRKLRSC